MTWTPWIEIEQDNTDDEAVQQLFNRTRDRVTGRPPDTVLLASSTPAVAGLLYDLQRAIYSDAKGLTLREKEIASLIVAVYNGCTH